MAQAIRSARLIFELDIRYAEATLDEAEAAITLAVACSKKFYDMTYVRLAERLDCQWCTADEKVLESAPATFPRKRVLRLADLRGAAWM